MNRSNGAPFWICAKKLPDDPNDTRTPMPDSRSKRAASSGITACRSEAAAMVSGTCQACRRPVANPMPMTSRPATAIALVDLVLFITNRYDFIRFD
jgi:hypothetical protein